MHLHLCVLVLYEIEVELRKAMACGWQEAVAVCTQQPKILLHFDLTHRDEIED